jgi:integrase
MISEHLADVSLRDDRYVLTNRQLRPDTRRNSLSRFNDSTWDLTPGIFENHSAAVTLNFDAFPTRWREDVKTYFWYLINDERLRPLASGPAHSRPSLQTIAFVRVHLLRLLTWFDSQRIRSLDRATPRILDALLGDLDKTDLSYKQKRSILTETRRLWMYRDVVPSTLRLPAAVPWLDERTYDLLGRPPSKRENLTERIADETLAPLIGWAALFVEDFADDIICGYRQYLELVKTDPKHRPARGPGGLQTTGRMTRLQAALIDLESSGAGLPGRVQADGSREIRWAHLARLANGVGPPYSRSELEIVAEAHLHIDDNAYLTVPCSANLDGKLWRGRFLAFDEIIPLAGHLQTASFILLTYLSGMRPGEALSLERGCLSFVADRWTVHGKRWKSALDGDGQKAVEGQERTVPWIVHPLVAKAIRVLEDLTPNHLLFPVNLRPRPLRGTNTPVNLRSGLAKTSSRIGTEIVSFIGWVNDYCSSNNREDTIPADPRGRVSPSRFRRTLAWHIVRRPRGLVAAAIQYGHVATYITQGYSGNYASGFPDELSFERWLEQIDNAQDADEYLDSGGRVSGPAAAEFEQRTRLATAKFSGRVIPTRRQATALLADPTLQVFKGEGMHCVYDQTTALCARDIGGPTLGDCRSACSNIARTDADIVELKEILTELNDDVLAPPIRYQRAQIVAARLTKAIQEHEKVIDDER